MSHTKLRLVLKQHQEWQKDPVERKYLYQAANYVLLCISQLIQPLSFKCECELNLKKPNSIHQYYSHRLSFQDSVASLYSVYLHLLFNMANSTVSDQDVVSSGPQFDIKNRYWIDRISENLL